MKVAQLPNQPQLTANQLPHASKFNKDWDKHSYEITGPQMHVLNKWLLL